MPPQYGEAPAALQRQVAGELQAYFATDARERAPTVVVNEVMAQRFHDLLRQIMRFVSRSAVASLDPSLVSAEVKHALLSYKNLESWSPVVVMPTTTTKVWCVSAITSMARSHERSSLSMAA